MNRKERRAGAPKGEQAPSAEAYAAAHLQAQGATSGVFIGAAIVGALVERGLVDPFQVAKWADLLAGQQTAENQAVAGVLTEFAGLLRTMATVPDGAGRA